MSAPKLTALEELKYYMMGWKCGAGVGIPVTAYGTTTPYVDGLAAGKATRLKVTEQARKKYKVSAKELVDAVLR